MADWQTNPTLLNALREEDADSAWERFYDQYAAALHIYSRSLGLSDSQAEEVTQETMIEMIRVLPDFVYNPARRFRNFLLTVAHRKAMRVLREERMRNKVRHTLRTDPIAARSGISPQASVGIPGGEGDGEKWRAALFEAAWREYKELQNVKPEVVEVFEAVDLRGEPPGEVARRLGLNVNAVYQIRSRVRRRLRQRVAQMERDLE